ncbi:MAG: polysaccharide deacetylase family protein [Pigmentiphaga sp.]|nr:polysaccharide deacetylase family protein [Pigmentiphaga sp.]
MTAVSRPFGAREISVPPDFRWPGGQRIGIVFRVALESWSDGVWPGISPMGNPLKPGYPDLNARSWGDYGVRRGIHRALDTLARHDVRATIITNGIIAERHPEIVRRCLAEGHEVCAHSYAMDVMPSYLTPLEEAENIRRTTDLIEAAGGVRPLGWISPRATPTEHTYRLLAEAGYQWHGDTLDDDLPYLQDFGDHRIVAIPGTMEVNDLPLANARQPAEVYVKNFERWLTYVQANALEVVKIDPTIHAHCYGRAAGIWAFDEVLAMAKQASNVWIGTRGEIAAHVLEP